MGGGIAGRTDLPFVLFLLSCCPFEESLVKFRAQSAPLVLLKNDHLPWSTDNEDAKSVNMDQTMSTLAQMPLLEGGFYVWDIILDEGDYNSIEGDGSGGIIKNGSDADDVSRPLALT